MTVRSLLSSVAALAAVASLLTMAPLAAAAASDDRVATEVEVRPGDNLTTLAARNGVSVADLRRWNPKKIGHSDLIRAGDTLVVMLAKDSPEAAVAAAEKGPEWTGYYDIKRGDTLGKVAAKLGVSMAELRHWNNLKPDAIIRAGRTLKYKKYGKRPPAESIGTTTNGRLENPVRLGTGPGYRLRFPKNTYTLPSVVKTLQRC
ncbi:MAG: LysM peptidoglycan-binding domain-containing protein, partial [Deltaproteobacteria bacterium]